MTVPVVAVFVAAVVSPKTIKEVCEAWKRGQPWRVEIADSYQTLGSPAPKSVKPFQITLKNIGATHRVSINKKNSKAKPQNKNDIDLKDGSSIEAFNGNLRAECLNTHWFTSLADARIQLEEWR